MDGRDYSKAAREEADAVENGGDRRSWVRPTTGIDMPGWIKLVVFPALWFLLGVVVRPTLDSVTQTRDTSIINATRADEIREDLREIKSLVSTLAGEFRDIDKRVYTLEHEVIGKGPRFSRDDHDKWTREVYEPNLSALNDRIVALEIKTGSR